MKQKNCYRFLYKIFLLLLGAVILIGHPLPVPGEDNDIIMTAMKDELDRSMKSLKIEGMDKPYYLDYSIMDYYQWSISGNFGALVNSEKNHLRLLKVNLRVGDYTLDNTGFVDRSSMFSTFMGGYNFVVVEDDYNTLRRSLWLATDQAYKDSLKQLAEKKAYLKTQVQDEAIPDFSKEPSLQKIAPAKTLEFDQEKWEAIVKKLSAVFKEFPALYESNVDMKVRLLTRYYVNSEGTEFRQPEIIVSLEANASTQAADGERLKNYVPFYAPSLDQLPSEKELTTAIRQMAQDLSALVTAPELDNYIGPVLFTNQASAELFTQVLTPQLSGQRPPESNMPQISQMASSTKLIPRLNRKILPTEISITDNPLQTNINNTPLIGSYIIDGQGVAVQPVNIVEKGILKTLLMSRQPRKEIEHSNGHGRAGVLGVPSVQIGNLIISATDGKSLQQLKDELIDSCKAQGLEFGLIIKSLDNPSITGTDDPFSFLSRAQKSEPGITNPILMYRIFVKDGREELVRGLSGANLTVNDLKDIIAVGNDTNILNRMMGSTGGIIGGVFSLFSSNRQQELGIPTSITSPSVLFEEVEFKKNDGKKDKLPLLKHPFFCK